MIARQPYLPRYMAGGPGNPLGARAMYLGNTIYRIHGTNDPSTIGGHVSSGCIRMTNEDVIDLYSRVNIGTKVIVLPMRRATPRCVEVLSEFASGLMSFSLAIVSVGCVVAGPADTRGRLLFLLRLLPTPQRPRRAARRG